MISEARRQYLKLYRKKNVLRRASYLREYKQKNPGRVALWSRGNRQQQHLQRKYRMTVAQYDEMWIEQMGLCAICHQSEHGRELAVDHNHQTSKVRGLLCFTCNTGIGLFQDSPALLDSAVGYLNNV